MGCTNFIDKNKIGQSKMKSCVSQNDAKLRFTYKYSDDEYDYFVNDTVNEIIQLVRR